MAIAAIDTSTFTFFMLSAKYWNRLIREFKTILASGRTVAETCP